MAMMSLSVNFSTTGRISTASASSSRTLPPTLRRGVTSSLGRWRHSRVVLVALGQRGLHETGGLHLLDEGAQILRSLGPPLHCAHGLLDHHETAGQHAEAALLGEGDH